MSRGGPIQGIRMMNTLFLAAEEEAQRVGEPRPGVEHLVLAALGLPDGSGRRAFARVGTDSDAFRTAVAAQHHDALRAVGIEVNESPSDNESPEPIANRRPFTTAPPTPAAQKAFKKVTKLVSREKSQLYGAYVVLVAAQSEHGTTARAFRYMGVDTEVLAEAARAEIDALNAADG